MPWRKLKSSCCTHPIQHLGSINRWVITVSFRALISIFYCVKECVQVSHFPSLICNYQLWFWHSFTSCGHLSALSSHVHQLDCISTHITKGPQDLVWRHFNSCICSPLAEDTVQGHWCQLHDGRGHGKPYTTLRHHIALRCCLVFQVCLLHLLMTNKNKNLRESLNMQM